jgi:hypothetical protein
MQGVICRACLAATLIVPASARAWDEEMGATAPKLLGQLPFRTTITHVDVALQGHTVSLTYHGQHASTTHQKLVLSSYLLPFGWQGVAADYPDLHFPELTVKVNEHLIAPTPRVTAFFEGKDVTADLRKVEIDPLRVALTEAALIDPRLIRTQSARRLFAAQSPDADRSYPLWQVAFSQTWTQTNLAVGPLSIQVTYNARPEKRQVNTSSKAFAAAVLAHCGDLEQIMSSLKETGGGPPAAVLIETISVPLQIANVAPLPSFLTVTPAAKTRPGLRLASTLACGPEESSLAGQPAIQSSKTATTSALSVLEIFIPS